VAAARDLEALFRADAARIQDQAGRRAGSALRVHRAFQERPLDTVPGIADRCGLSYPATSANVQVLVDLGILREITGKQRGRVYCYDRYLKALDGGLS
jgi:Fic family protein